MIGDRNEGYVEIMGEWGLGEMNNNVERFADFCATDNFVIGGSVLKHDQKGSTRPHGHIQTT